MHDLISRTKYSRFHGTRLPVDIGEMPSTLLENWCWNKDILKELSCHYTTMDSTYLEQWRKDNPNQPDPPTKIPDELLDNIIKSRNIDRGQYHLHQLYVKTDSFHSFVTDVIEPYRNLMSESITRRRTVNWSSLICKSFGTI